MKILSIETSTKQFSLAVSKNEQILRYRNVRLQRVLSSSIIPSIQTILHQANVSLNQLDGFAVDLGPGSFTSLRVGLATIKALSYGSDKPVVGIPSFDVLAMNTPKNFEGVICPLCDAKRGLVYASIYQTEKGKIKRKSEYQLIDIHQLLKQFDRGIKFCPPILFIGDGIPLYQETICTKFKNDDKIIFAEKKDWYPQAKQLALLAYERFKKAKFDNIDRLNPLYLYPDDCQIVSHKSQVTSHK